MARNRTIYQTEAIYVSDNTRSITKSEHKNISRVQSANYGFSINRERVNQYGQLGEIDSIVVEAPNVDFEMSYYLTNGDNEYFLNLDTGYGGFLKNQIISSGQNIYVVNVPEGKDVQDQNWDNFSVIGIGNAFVTDYTVDFGVGQMSRVNVGFSALNISSQINLSKVSGELIGIENAGINPISGVKYTDPITIAPIVNNSGQSAIRPSDTSITITPTKTLGDNDSISVLSTLDEKAHIQTASLNIALDRTSLQRLGSNFAYAKVVEPPTTATVSISAIVNETQSSSLSDILDHSNEYTIEIESVDPDGYQLCKYSLVGAKLDSESFGSAIGSNKVVDLTFTTQLGGIGQTNYNMFFEKYGFLDFFPSAAAAYSLRNLTADFDQKIVRVRRESDNSERDFTEYDIQNGTMVDWVNKQVIPPLDIRELDDENGNRPDTNPFIDTPAAAYSLRSLGENQANITIDDSSDERDGETGKYVAQVRRVSDSTVKSFTASEVSDGTLESFCGTEDITSSLNLLSVSGEVSSVTDRSNFTITYLGIGSPEFTALRNNSTLGAGTYKLTGTIVATGLSHNVQFRSSGGGSTYQSSPFTNGTNVINETFTLTGDPNNLTIYAVANATGSLVVSNLKLEQISCDGRVKTWYDQSGNTKDLIQSADANQPKIVNAGSLIDGGLRFDDNQFLETADTFTYGSGTTLSTFITNKSDADENAYLFRFVTDYIIWNTGGGIRRVSAGANADAGDIGANEELWTTISELNTAGGTSNFYADGTLVSAEDTPIGTSTVSNRVLNVGGSSATNYWNGTVNEVILYDTDQSANRKAIEANIGETYGITGIPAVDNTVNGFVQTWYDQSGNGNDAVQNAAANQPKIVGEVTSGQPHAFLGAIDFDGTQYFTRISSGILTDIQDTFSTFVGTRRNSSQGYVAQASAAGGTDARLYIRFNNATIGAVPVSVSLDGVNDQESLFTVEGSSGVYNGYKNGANTGGPVTTTTTGASTFTLGASSNGGAAVDGTLKEFIIYDSDQSSNRPAIETNIANHYGITLS